MPLSDEQKVAVARRVAADVAQDPMLLWSLCDEKKLRQHAKARVGEDHKKVDASNRAQQSEMKRLKDLEKEL